MKRSSNIFIKLNKLLITKMNSCGVNIPYVLQKFVKNEDIEESIAEYFFQNFVIKDILFTPNSYIFDKEGLYDDSINNLIEKLPNKECFARFDTCSSKP